MGQQPLSAAGAGVRSETPAGRAGTATNTRLVTIWIIVPSRSFRIYKAIPVPRPSAGADFFCRIPFRAAAAASGTPMRHTIVSGIGSADISVGLESSFKTKYDFFNLAGGIGSVTLYRKLKSYG
jgi:hypothetical protein